jgi:hypothetical protein
VHWNGHNIVTINHQRAPCFVLVAFSFGQNIGEFFPSFWRRVLASKLSLAISPAAR